MIDEIPSPYGTLWTTVVWIQHQVWHRALQRSQVLWMSPIDLGGGYSCSKIPLSYLSNPVASWMHLPNCRCFEDDLRMLLQSVGALCIAQGGSGRMELLRTIFEVDRSVRDVRMWVPDVSTFCRCRYLWKLRWSELSNALEAVTGMFWRDTWTPWSHKFADALGHHDHMNLDTTDKGVRGCTWRPRWHELEDTLEVHVDAKLEAMILWVLRCTWKLGMSELRDWLDSAIMLGWRCTSRSCLYKHGGCIWMTMEILAETDVKWISSHTQGHDVARLQMHM